MNYRIPIAVKLITITVCLLAAAALLITFRSADFFEQSSRSREEENNANEAKARALQIENLLFSLVEKTRSVGLVLHKEFETEQERNASLDLNFKSDPSLVAVEVYTLNVNSDVERVRRTVNEEYLAQFKLDAAYVDEVRRRHEFPLTSVFAGNVEIINSSEVDGIPMITMGVPFVRDQFGRITHIAVSDIRLDRIQKMFSVKSERTSYLIDKRGLLLAHPNDDWAINAYNMGEVPIVRRSLTEKAISMQEPYYDPESNGRYIGAYYKTSLGPTVVTQISEDFVLFPSRKVKRNAFYTAGLVVSGALFLIFLFSFSLTIPIEKLLEATQEIAKGNFEVKANVRSHDEVGQLAQAFDQMTEGLRERDKIKNVMTKFHGSMADELLAGDLSLGGERKEVTVFFSDIRDFTKFSEGHTPEEVVEMLNEYFARMVSIINKNGGVVDKFIGDAIMAIWGAVHPTEQDPFNCVKACIEMRQAVAELNEIRLGRGQTPIKIGMGVHSGPAITGNIGSDERMEFTVIGDTVNMASRIEASTKAFGTDLLLSDAIVNIVKEKYIVDLAGKAEVKGKSEALAMYKCRGFIDENGNEVRVQTEYSDYEAGHDAKVKIA
ncbi:MAG: HAMP domain-containing protein [Bdellovibrionales bacterium]|nr:HAMP domain-containing protein [Bdellovibrionales bacterium]